MVPAIYRKIFVFHFVANLSAAIPLLLLPHQFLESFQWDPIDPVTARLVGAALFGIGLESFFSRNATLPVFLSLLRVKIAWSLAANVGIALSLVQGAPHSAWIFQSIFAAFSALWILCYLKLRPQRRASV